MAQVIRYVNTAGTVGTQDGTTSTAGNSGTAAFATLRQAADAIGASVVGYVGSGNFLTIYCSGSAADTSDTDQGAWDMTTTATEYLQIIGEQSPNHFSSTPTGVYDTGLYRITATNRNGLYNNIPAHLRIEGVQVQVTVNDTDSYVCLKTANQNISAVDADFRVGYCIVQGVQTNGSLIAFESRPLDGITGAGTSKFYNCIGYDCNTNFNGEFVTTEFYNCTAIDSPQINFLANANDGALCINCLATGAGIEDFLGGADFHASSNFNASGDDTAPGANSIINQTFVFVNEGSNDFHLTSGSPGVDDGTSDPASGLYGDDIDGGIRTGSWDIGADEEGVVLEEGEEAALSGSAITGGHGTSVPNFQIAL